MPVPNAVEYFVEMWQCGERGGREAYGEIVFFRMGVKVVV